jgi:hypothetical protein
MKPRKKKRKNDQAEFDSYNRLIKDLGAILEEANRNGIDLDKRHDALQCQDCACYEVFDEEENICVCDTEDCFVKEEPFIIIDRQEKTYHRHNNAYYKATFTFICSVCGAYQTQTIKEKMDMV